MGAECREVGEIAGGRSQFVIPAKQRSMILAGECRGPSLRSDVMKTKRVPPRVEYVLEAQALKEARDDPHRCRSSPEILLHDGAGSKRQDFTGGSGEQREAGVAPVLSAVSRAASAGGGGGVRLLAGVSRGGGAGGEAVGAGASAAGEGHSVGQVEE